MKRARPLRILGCGVLTAAVALRFLGSVRADTPPPVVDIWSWGSNSQGQLGSVPANLTVPSPVHEVRSWVAVSAGTSHTLALTDTGEVWAWGHNQDGELGNGTTSDSMLPVQVPGLSGITMIAAGAFHNLAYRASDATLWAWGENSSGQVGLPSDVARSTVPVQVPIPGPLRAVAAGGIQSLLLTTDGVVYAWGGNSFGELGLGPGDFVNRYAPTAVSLPAPARAIAAGFAHSIAAIEPDGQVYGWGWNVFGQLGRGVLGTPDSGEPVPAPVLEATHAVALAAGDFHCLAQTDDGHVWAWGYDTEGQVGAGAHSTGKPFLVPLLIAIDSVTAIDASGLNSMALRSNGEVWTWGNCQFGACGYNGRHDRDHPEAALLPVPAKAISCGGHHEVALAAQNPTNRVVAFGAGGSSLAPSTERPRARDVASLGDVAQVSSGWTHTLVLDARHQVWAFGDNTNGQLGVPGGGTDDPVPVNLPLEGAQGFVEVAARANHSFALRSDGVVWAWGDGADGELGVGGTSAVTPPTKVALASVVSVAAGERHTLALDANGAVWAWGENRNGQLGFRPTANLTLIPVQVPELIGPTLIAAGGYHSLAVNLTGGLSAWGAGVRGQLGRDSFLDSDVPVLVDLPSDVVAVSAGRFHTLALRAGGTVAAFGDNSECQMATWPDVDGSEPAMVPGAGLAIAVQAGDYDALTLGYAGNVTGWGNDSSGQLGRADNPLPHADCTPKALPVTGATVLGAGLAQCIVATASAPSAASDASIGAVE